MALRVGGTTAQRGFVPGQQESSLPTAGITAEVGRIKSLCTYSWINTFAIVFELKAHYVALIEDTTAGRARSHERTSLCRRHRAQKTPRCVEELRCPVHDTIH